MRYTPQETFLGWEITMYPLLREAFVVIAMEMSQEEPEPGHLSVLKNNPSTGSYS